MSENIFLRALDKAVSALTGPENAVRPPARTVVEYPGQHVPAATGPAVERATFVPDGVNPDFKGASGRGTLDGDDFTPSTQLSDAAMRELHPKIRPALPPHFLAGVPFPTPAQQLAFDALVKRRGYAPPKAVAAELAKLDAPWTRLQQAIGEAAKSQGDAYHRHMQDIARRTAEGDETVKREDSWSRADWDADARERIAAFKVECKRIEAQAWKIAEPALREKADACDAAADALEDEARVNFERFNVPFIPPPYVLILRVYAASLRDDSRRNVGKPSSMLETL